MMIYLRSYSQLSQLDGPPSAQNFAWWSFCHTHKDEGQKLLSRGRNQIFGSSGDLAHSPWKLISGTQALLSQDPLISKAHKGQHFHQGPTEKYQ